MGQNETKAELQKRIAGLSETEAAWLLARLREMVGVNAR